MKMIKFMAFLMFGGLMFTACSENEEDVIKPEEQELIVTPQLICGNDTVELSGHAEPTIAMLSELVVNFENGAAIRGAEVCIQSMKAVDGKESMTWEADETVFSGSLSVNNMSYIKFEEPLYFVYGKKYQVSIKVTDALQKETVKAFTFNGSCDVVDFEGEYFSALIDDPQYGGALIYSADEYSWTDEITSLCSKIVKADWSAYGAGFGWESGIAISNYVNPEASSYQEQLSVAKADGNFGVAFDNGSQMAFADGKAHTFVAIDLSPVAYAYNSMLKACGEGYSFDVILTFEQENGAKVEKVVSIAKDDKVQSGFETVSLGIKATSVSISFDGSDKGNWGLNTPKYIAIDNIVIAE